MNQADTNSGIPPGKIIKVLILLSLGMQIIVISQIYFNTPELFADLLKLGMRMLRGLMFTFFASALLTVPSLQLVRRLNRKLPWRTKPLKRFAIQFAAALLGGLIVTPLVIIPAMLFFGLESDSTTVLNNVYYMIVLNIFLMMVLEALIYSDDSARSVREAERLGRELISEASARAIMEANMRAETEKAAYARKLIEQERQLNLKLQEEILKREQLTEQLNQSREQLSSILTNLAGAAFRCLFDRNYTMIYISEKIFDISGYHASELVDKPGASFASLIYPGDQDQVRAAIALAMNEQRHYDIEYRIIHKNGKLVWVHESGKRAGHTAGEQIFIDGIITDITRRKEAEQAAKESQQNFREFMDFLPQPVFELDMQGNVVFGNKAGYAFFGPPPNEPGKMHSVLDCFVKEDLPLIAKNIQASNDGMLTEPSEYTAIKHDGTRCPVLVFGSPIISNGKVTGRRGIIIDISERKRQEMNLLKAKEELERINNSLEQSVAERTRQLTEANTQLLKLQKENLQSQFEVLKQQVNPHFLFNSLNVLTSLIKLDPDLAESFTERLSKVYRYVLEYKEKDLVSLSTEMDFLQAYLFLLEIRFMHKIRVEIKIEKTWLEFFILPLAIQLIIENAIKHNTFSKSKPLLINIFVDENRRLNIVNNLNLRETKPISTGVGLDNIKRRYALVSNDHPAFLISDGHFIARLPLLKPEKSTSV
ncbi:MAG: PAS domain S-box protein [Bacteroidetes bacterium]|nr:PAS domain S-box protein [Bacteroidota bacterium]